MRLLALYLPQYHEIPENNEWWGDGYTEWTAVKNAVPIYKGHIQPRIPLNNFYYDLSDESGEAWKLQAEWLREYRIYGLCIYHYWFGEKQLLQKPMEILLDHREIDIRYCICWANETWKRTWYDLNEEILIRQTYGDKKEYERHYKYLSQFFKDERYIMVDNKPLINIYKHADIDDLDGMLSLWNKLALADGFAGICVVTSMNSINNPKPVSNYIYGQYMFEPGYSTKNGLGFLDKVRYYSGTAWNRMLNRFLEKKKLEQKIDTVKINKRSIKNFKKLNEIYPEMKIMMGAFPGWDNTPRRQYKGSVCINATPEEFKRHLTSIKSIVDENDFVYINAWNEWGEGAYLEPDEKYGYAYLEAVKEVMEQDKRNV